MILRPKLITRADLRANPDRLYLFGDNIQRRGLGGQAREMRGEPNAVGCPTKWTPTATPSAYFADADFPGVKADIDDAFLCLARHIEAGGTVVIPYDGIGTGLAELPIRAPRINAYIGRCIARLEALASEK